MSRHLFVAFLVFVSWLPSAAVVAFSASAASTNNIFDFLKWGGSEPSFDVLQSTMDYVDAISAGELPKDDFYHKDYVLRGPVVGPMSLKDLREAQKNFQLKKGFPDLKAESFGFTIDPENPYRCFYFQRWKGTNTGTVMAGKQALPPTGNYMETPLAVFSVVWTPDESIIYEQVGAVVDRFEGINTNGRAAVFGAFEAAGMNLPAPQPGSWLLRILQRLGHLSPENGRSFSSEEDVPNWWTSKSRGADPN